MRRVGRALLAALGVTGVFVLTLISAGWFAFWCAVNGTSTILNPVAGRGIARHPAPANYHFRHPLTVIPHFDPNSKDPFQVDLRSMDLSPVDVSGHEEDLREADFDDLTKWPPGVRTMATFRPAEFIRLGKDPGLGIRELHEMGITGRGVGIAILDSALLVDHREYGDRLRMYEEVQCGDRQAQMHGPAVASIAVGKSVGVAPGADLYYIAESHAYMDLLGGVTFDLRPIARSINRILDANRRLPPNRRIRVISLSFGWHSFSAIGSDEVLAALERAKKEGVFFISCSVTEDYPEFRPAFNGLGREPDRDPNMAASYEPGCFWAGGFVKGSRSRARLRTKEPHGMLLVPMDSRSTASPTGTGDYVFYREGGWSWCVPYLAGLYALACQVKPDVTPREFWEAAMATGDTTQITFRGHPCTLGKVVNPKDLIARLERRSAVHSRTRESPYQRHAEAVVE